MEYIANKYSRVNKSIALVFIYYHEEYSMPLPGAEDSTVFKGKPFAIASRPYTLTNKFNETEYINFLPLLVGQISSTESINLNSGKIRVGGLSISISDTIYNGERFSENFSNQSFISNRVEIFFAPEGISKTYGRKNVTIPSHNDIMYDLIVPDDSHKIFTGKITKASHSKGVIKFDIEDQSYSTIKDVQIPKRISPAGWEYDIDFFEAYETKPIPLSYGYIDHAPTKVGSLMTQNEESYVHPWVFVADRKNHIYWNPPILQSQNHDNSTDDEPFQWLGWRADVDEDGENDYRRKRIYYPSLFKEDDGHIPIAIKYEFPYGTWNRNYEIDKTGNTFPKGTITMNPDEMVGNPEFHNSMVESYFEGESEESTHFISEMFRPFSKKSKDSSLFMSCPAFSETTNFWRPDSDDDGNMFLPQQSSRDWAFLRVLGDNTFMTNNEWDSPTITNNPAHYYKELGQGENYGSLSEASGEIVDTGNIYHEVASNSATNPQIINIPFTYDGRLDSGVAYNGFTICYYGKTTKEDGADTPIHLGVSLKLEPVSFSLTSRTYMLAKTYHRAVGSIDVPTGFPDPFAATWSYIDSYFSIWGGNSKDNDTGTNLEVYGGGSHLMVWGGKRLNTDCDGWTHMPPTSEQFSFDDIVDADGHDLPGAYHPDSTYNFGTGTPSGHPPVGEQNSVLRHRGWKLTDTYDQINIGRSRHASNDLYAGSDVFQVAQVKLLSIYQQFIVPIAFKDKFSVRTGGRYDEFIESASQNGGVLTSDDGDTFVGNFNLSTILLDDSPVNSYHRNIAAQIAHLVKHEIGVSISYEIFNPDSLLKVVEYFNANAYFGDFSISEYTAFDDVLAQMLKHTPMFINFDTTSQDTSIIRFNIMKSFYRNPNDVLSLGDAGSKTEIITNNDIIKYKFSKTSPKDVATKVVLNYHYDYASNEYTKQYELGLGDFIEMGDNEYSHIYSYYGIPSDDNLNTKTFDVKHLRNVPGVNDYYFSPQMDTLLNSTSRESYLSKRYFPLGKDSQEGKDNYHVYQVAKYLLLDQCNDHLEVDLTLPLNYSNLQIGDLIRFKELPDGIKPFGSDIRVCTNPNRALRFPMFMIYFTKKTLNSIQIKARQLHSYEPINVVKQLLADNDTNNNSGFRYWLGEDFAKEIGVTTDYLEEQINASIDDFAATQDEEEIVEEPTPSSIELQSLNVGYHGDGFKIKISMSFFNSEDISSYTIYRDNIDISGPITDISGAEFEVDGYLSVATHYFDYFVESETEYTYHIVAMTSEGEIQSNSATINSADEVSYSEFIVYGDVNADGLTSILDVIQIIQYIMEVPGADLNLEQQYQADFNMDTIINILDVILMVHQILGTDPGDN